MNNFHRDYPVLIPYQIDFHTTTVGRHIRQTKRHVTWRFGFAHIPSLLLDHKTGVACRGLELDIHLVWSVASGKHALYLNNILVHQTFPTSSSLVPAQRFEHSMYVPEGIVPGGHVIHITAWALGFGSHASPEKQFLMTFDGQSYSEFYPIYKLGSTEMKRKYELALEKAKEKMSHIPVEGIVADDKSRVSQQQHGSGTHAADIPAQTDRYWEYSTVPLPAHVQTRLFPAAIPSPMTSEERGPSRQRFNSNASAPDLLPPDIRPEDVARNDREEETLLAQARLESFRDLKRQQEQRSQRAASNYMYAANERQEEQFIAQARIQSFRDLRGGSRGHGRVSGGGRSGGVEEEEEISIPSFARPPRGGSKSPQKQERYHRDIDARGQPTQKIPSHSYVSQLKPVQEGRDLLDDTDNHQDWLDSHWNPSQGLMRSESSVTLDTALKSPDDDLMSLTSGMSEVYSHLDPRQNWKTQQNVSFRLQKPPIYADTLAGDLIAPSASFSSNANAQESYYYGSGTRAMDYGTTMRGQSSNHFSNHHSPSFAFPTQSTIPNTQATAGFVAAPPPTWETLKEAYAIPSNHYSNFPSQPQTQHPSYSKWP